MICKNCQSENSENNSFCNVCGAKLRTPRKGKVIKIIIVISLIVAFAAGVFFLVINLQKSALQKKMMGKWETITEFEDGIEHITYAKITEDSIKISYGIKSFNYYYSYETEPITMRYEIISSDKIRIKGTDEVIKITFGADNEMITLSPALSSDEKYEIWFLDDYLE